MWADVWAFFDEGGSQAGTFKVTSNLALLILVGATLDTTILDVIPEEKICEGGECFTPSLSSRLTQISRHRSTPAVDTRQRHEDDRTTTTSQPSCRCSNKVALPQMPGLPTRAIFLGRVGRASQRTRFCLSSLLERRSPSRRLSFTSESQFRRHLARDHHTYGSGPPRGRHGYPEGMNLVCHTKRSFLARW